ncbi:hypothetical protein C5E45_22510 [Nocardia nova]|uniref:SnoaL-like domain-containing protein n=1 Tax=Nocardia nova TaxID=37330 RepID=A0A2S6AKY1_9NOCA|nr:nuclear transport factor 2 family protein [Nocardia nova]PPJ31651.1 hypothetical protein C5E41_07050 [Nocardia nova]PPJ35889.1 hypothetical protein C5E45_22510 [Nocardia nova]
MLPAEDHFAITDLINLHGHLTDNGDFDGWPALFAEDVVYDVSASASARAGRSPTASCAHGGNRCDRDPATLALITEHANIAPNIAPKLPARVIMEA